ncbi:DUF5685 family protein [Williamsia muralis]|uniref:DUF5685 family protein n=1 Tax=Williamsia marianensis TaxID=85044 RepID=UPI000DE666A0|nr:DUF5685 family protein [Williamsia marianensis]PVY32767.1 hypothetical protein C7458_102519 [Williamsia marianensis]
MFGVLSPCVAHLDEELGAQWRAHLCGVCLALRSSHGQLSRLTTNTDAVVVSVLVDAQRESAPELVSAGRCALRGMRGAQVVSASDVSVRLGATASLTLASAKAADVVAERAAGVASPSAVRAEGARWAEPRLRSRALADAPVSAAMGGGELLTQLGAQAQVESGSVSLVEITQNAASAGAAVFAATAELAGVPGNREVLAGIGRDFGRCAHLLDAVEDLERDRAGGDFNPLIATGTTVEFARTECVRLVDAIRVALDGVRLRDDRLLRMLLIGGLNRALVRVFGPDPDAVFTSPGQRRQPQLPPFYKRVLPWMGVYCTGYACCADHTNPCNGRRHQAACNGCDCCNVCDCCDC